MISPADASADKISGDTGRIGIDPAFPAMPSSGLAAPVEKENCSSGAPAHSGGSGLLAFQ